MPLKLFFASPPNGSEFAPLEHFLFRWTYLVMGSPKEKKGVASKVFGSNLFLDSKKAL